MDNGISKRNLWLIIAGIVVFAILVFGGTAITVYTDWLWFRNLGYASIFSKIIWTRIGLGLVFGAVFFAIVYFNLWLATRFAPPVTRRYERIEDDLSSRFSHLAKRGLNLLLLLGTILVSVLVGVQASSHWNEWLRFRNAVPFGTSDPILHQDIGFYVFRLPFWNYLYGWLFFTLVVAFIVAAVLHYMNEGIDFLGNSPRFAPGVKNHIAILLALMLLLKGAGYWLGRYQLLTTSGTLFDGPGYTDVHVRISALIILLVTAVLAALLVLVNARRRGIWLAAGAIAGLIVMSIIVGGIVPAAIEQFSVTPNQLEKQTPYISNAIKYTQQAFHLGNDSVAARPFNYVPSLSPETVANNSAATQNVRLWDYDPLKRVYNQLEAFQSYYQFDDVDIDRYTINGSYRQVMLSARELSGLPEGSSSWLNQYLRYTHGYGYAMSPVNVVTGEGLPDYFVSGIPPKATGGITLKKPQIYFGEQTGDYVIVNTNQGEFDYLAGNQAETTNYDAKGGPEVGSFFRKVAYAIRFGDANILLSSALKPTSRVLFRRNIAERVETLFPFLSYDNDPYLVTVDGKLYWFHDAYTTTDQYPYSRSSTYGFLDNEQSVNYVRNSVKLVTDAYSGDVTAYVADDTDPIIRTYQKIFPKVFKPISQMPSGFREHIRYPEDLFKIQAQTYSKYHMTQPSAFYGNSDLWQMPATTADTDGQSATLEPYYIITKLPDSQTEEFILIIPMVRANKENMVAWMAAKCDGPEYGKLVAYKFPTGQTVFGPSQVMARANQTPEISAQLTLWGQHGSTVVRGNLLAIPIENSVLYVEPLYLQGTTTPIPEFKQVIVALGDKVVMRPTFEQALASVVGVESLPTVAAAATPTTGKPVKTPSAGKPVPVPAPIAPAQDVKALAEKAANQFKQAEDAQKRGDWAEYGRQIEALKKTIAELQQKSK